MADPQLQQRCFPCQDQGYDGEDSLVRVPTDLCGFHAVRGPRANRAHYPRWREGLQEEGGQVVQMDTLSRRIRVGMSPREVKSLIMEAPHPVDQGIIVCRIHEVTGFSLELLSKYCGKSGPWASLQARLGRLTPTLQQAVRDGTLGMGVGRLLGLVPAPFQETLATEMEERGTFLSEAPGFIKRRLSELQAAAATPEEPGGEEEPAAAHVALPIAAGEKESAVESPAGEPDVLTVLLRVLGGADRELSQIASFSFRDLRNAFMNAQDLRIARNLLLTLGFRLNELECLFEAIRLDRFAELPGLGAVKE